MRTKRVIDNGMLVEGQGLAAIISTFPFVMMTCAFTSSYITALVYFILLVLFLATRNKVILNYNAKKVEFHFGFWYSRKYDASKYHRCKIKYLNYETSIRNNSIGHSYSVMKRALYIADIVNKEEELITVGSKKELTRIAEELEIHFGIIKVN